MTKTISRFSAGSTSKPSISLPRNLIRNEILLGLPRKELDLVAPELEAIELVTHALLNEVGEPIRYCYFPNSGMVSILSVMGDGKSVEVGVTGKEGFVGLPLIVDLHTSATRALVQISGHAFRMHAADLGKLLPKCPQLEKALNRYSQFLGLQATQVAACNRLHEVNQRLARWLLMSQDRVGGASVPLTQEFLAHMLGTRRASVTVAAGVLQKAGLIHYTRGALTITSRSKLEAAACECYGIMTEQHRHWQKELA
jgi:CRP-like cAMP-binding protein